MADPTTREELKRAVTAAAILLALEDAHLFDLIPVNPLNVDHARALELVELGRTNGIWPDIPHEHAGSITDHDGPGE